MVRSVVVSLPLLALAASGLYASGPADRAVTDPQKVVSDQRQGGAPVSVDAILDTKATSQVAVSRDGHHVVYTSNASGRFNLWTMNLDGTGARQITRSDDRQVNAIFSPDGKQVLYAQDKGGDEYFDLYSVPSEGGEPKDITKTPDVSESGFRFSPDGHALAFGVKSKKSPSTDLSVMTWPEATARQLTHETDPKAGWSVAFWSPDGKFLFANRSASLQDSDVYRIEVATGKAEKLTAHEGNELIAASDISPDGKTLLVGSNRKGGFENVALLDLGTKDLRWVTDTQWSASPMNFSPDGRTVTYILNADGRVAVLFADVRTLQASTRGVPDGLNFGAASPSSFLPDGTFVLMHQDSTHPADLYLLRQGNKLQQITHNESPALATAVLPSSQLVTYKSFDGRLISAFIWVPFHLKRDGSAPAVVLPHGGPTGQTVDAFNREAVLLASRGFVVIAPNVRGSTGYGMDFQKANTKDLGGADLKDEIAGVDFLKATGYIDPKRVGIWGGSYGGFMTLMAIGKTPTLWAAAVDEYGILDWYTMLQHEDPFLQEYEKQLLGDPTTDRAVYEASSPLKYIRSATAPLLVLQGDRDIRVPREEAEQVVKILKDEGRTVDAVFYPEEGHGFAKKEHQHDELTRAVDWLTKYLQPGGSRSSAAATE